MTPWAILPFGHNEPLALCDHLRFNGVGAHGTVHKVDMCCFARGILNHHHPLSKFQPRFKRRNPLAGGCEFTAELLRKDTRPQVKPSVLGLQYFACDGRTSRPSVLSAGTTIVIALCNLRFLSCRRGFADAVHTCIKSLFYSRQGTNRQGWVNPLLSTRPMRGAPLKRRTRRSGFQLVEALF